MIGLLLTTTINNSKFLKKTFQKSNFNFKMFPLSKRNSNVKYNNKILEPEKQRKKPLKNKWVWSCNF